LLSAEATPQTKGSVFGFHRAMDTLGAVIGPLLALIYLSYYPNDYRKLFFIAFVPGIVAIGFTFLVKEKRQEILKPRSRTRLLDFVKYWKESSPGYRRVVGGLLAFALFNSSDVFLLLRVKEAGYDDATLIGLYIFYNLVYAIFSFPLGKLADRLGMKKVFIAGLLLFAATYTGMVFATGKAFLAAMFFVYGVYAAATEGVAKAWITNICKKENTATAIGTYTAFQSIATLIASSLAGLIWFRFGAAATFIVTAAVALVVSIYFVGIKGEEVA
jgi:MFS family permease